MVTALSGGLWAIGMGHLSLSGLVLWPGAMLGWAFVFGDNISSFDEVVGTVTLISIATNGIMGLILGALVGGVIGLRKRLKDRKVGEQSGGE